MSDHVHPKQTCRNELQRMQRAKLRRRRECESCRGRTEMNPITKRAYSKCRACRLRHAAMMGQKYQRIGGWGGARVAIL